MMTNDDLKTRILEHLVRLDSIDERDRQEYLVEMGEDLRALCLIAVDLACPECHGTGRKCYSNTSTWMGGVGGAALTSGVCDKCWGTGRTDQRGADLRAIRNAGFSEAKAASSEWFSWRIGIGINSQKEHFRAIAKKLRAVRWGDNFWTHRAADTLADALEEMAGPKED